MPRTEEILSNVSYLPIRDLHKPLKRNPEIISETPVSDKIIEQAMKLNNLSAYKTNYDFDIYKNHELRFKDRKFRGGVTYKTPFKLVNSHKTCQQCLYAFETDTYGRGCIHDCLYCYAMDQLTQKAMWNNPMPAPADFTEMWKVFYTVFETDKPSKWRSILTKRVPLRIGSMSDSFMWMDKKYKVTQELLKLLDFYKYPYLIFTRSDLIASEPYIDLLNPKLCSIQMSISSTNDDLNKIIEAGAPSSKRRLEALETMVKEGFWTTVRLNPFFPIYADGYFTNPDFDKTKMPEPFHYSSFEMVDEIATYGVQSILTGMVRLSPVSMCRIEKRLGRNLRELFTGKTKSVKDWHYSDKEVRAYYERIQAKCKKNGVQFTTCYIGNGENQFWNDQDLWDNKKDCCNVKGRINSFNGANSRDIDWKTRLRHTAHKCSAPVDPKTLHKELGTKK
jgi:DNA repair photolyase